LNIDGGRVDVRKDLPASISKNNREVFGDYVGETGNEDGNNRNIGRYPANLLLDPTSAKMLGEQTGTLTRGSLTADQQLHGGFAGKRGVIYGKAERGGHGEYEANRGGPSRFFYCSKASRSERQARLKGTKKNFHPCVKPIKLCQYLATLLLPPSSVKDRSILVPFSGSGSEGIGCLLAGWDKITMIEKDKKFCTIARQRMKHHSKKQEG